MARKSAARRPVASMKNRVIIFSSQESLSLAKAIQANLHTDAFTTKVWTDGFFKFSQPYISNFRDIQYEYDFALVICGSDDVTTTRGKKKKTPRDNILLELGMCISSFTLDKVLIVKHKDIQLPSDLDGINPIEYTMTADEDIDAVAGTISSKISQQIQHTKCTSHQYIKLSWTEYLRCIKKITETLGQSASLGGFEYDAIIGISRGGLMVADLIARENSQNVPIVPLLADAEPEYLVLIQNQP